MRVRRRVLQAPVVRFRHRRTGRVVTIVATRHVGEAAYYEQLLALITGLEAAGAVIYSEGMPLADEGEWGAASAERAARDGYFDDKHKSFRAICDYLGWVPQRFPLADRPSWRNADMTDLEFTRRARLADIDGMRTLEHRMGLAALSDQGAGAGMAIVMRLTTADRLGLLTRLSRTVIGDGDAARRVDGVLVGERNRLLLAALPSDKDAVLVWGAGHLPGLAAGLRAAGYRRQATEWVNVGTLPPMWKSLRVFWNAIG